MIRKIHEVIANNIIDRNGKPFEPGKFRTAVVAIGGLYLPVSKPEKSDQDIDRLLKWKESVNANRRIP